MLEYVLFKLSKPAVGGISYGLRVSDEQGKEKQRIIGHKTSLLRRVWEEAKEGMPVHFNSDN